MNNLTKNITLHQLIDEENPHCIYCKHKCNIFVESDLDISLYPAPTPWIHISKYYCESCNEVFRVHQLDSGSTISFDFTCKDVWIGVYYDTENFCFKKRNNGAMNPQWINGLDNINFDFSDKEKLYNKIKTYLVFS